MPNGRFAYAHLLNTHLTPLRRLFLDRSPPHFLSAAAPRRFEAGVCKQTSGGHLPSFRAAPRKPACASSRSCRHYYSDTLLVGLPGILHIYISDTVVSARRTANRTGNIADRPRRIAVAFADSSSLTMRATRSGWSRPRQGVAEPGQIPGDEPTAAPVIPSRRAAPSPRSGWRSADRSASHGPPHACRLPNRGTGPTLLSHR